MTGSTERARPEILETLTAGIAGLTSSEAWRRYLDVQRRFYRYSFANTLLISLQRPDATRVAGFHAWLKLGRAVRKGERGIAILAPCVYRARGREEAADDRPDETADRVIRGFKVVHVFDVAQTDGEPLPEVARRLDSAEDYPVLDCLQAVGALLGYTLVREDLGPSTNGDCDFLARRIRVHSQVSDAQAVKTLIHELAHAVLHDGMPLDRARAELEAESVAFMVSAEVGVDSGGYSFGYLAGWAGGGEEAIAAIKACGDRIASGARRILELLEKTA